MKITFDNSAADYVLRALMGSCYNPKCIFCKKKITKHNLGAVIKEGYICDNVCCIIEYAEKARKSEKK